MKNYEEKIEKVEEGILDAIIPEPEYSTIVGFTVDWVLKRARQNIACTPNSVLQKVLELLIKNDASKTRCLRLYMAMAEEELTENAADSILMKQDGFDKELSRIPSDIKDLVKVAFMSFFKESTFSIEKFINGLTVAEKRRIRDWLQNTNYSNCWTEAMKCYL